MDINACLEEIRMLLIADEFNGLDDIDQSRILELMYSLDQWMSNGGFMPTYWQAKR